jgi:hypothetical protein
MPKYQYPGEKESKDPIFNINKKKLNFRSSSVPKMIGNKQLSNDSTKINEKDENKNIEEKAKSTVIANNENDNNNKKINKKNYSICYESNINCIDNNSNKNKSKTPLLGLTKNNNIDNNNTFKIDRTKYGKKPTPFYGFSHDPFLQSSENLEHLNEIENNKRIKEMRKKILSQKILENDKNYIANEYKKNPNSMFLSNNDTYSLQNKKLNRSGSFTNAIGTFRERINKSTNQFGPPQKTYVAQLENFLNKNTIQKQFEQKISYPIQSQKINSSKETKKALLE